VSTKQNCQRLQLHGLTSPNNWNLAFSPRKTPAVVGPEFNPKRMESSVVLYCVEELLSVRKMAMPTVYEAMQDIQLTGPKVLASSVVILIICSRQSRANRAMTTA
jgi:hypothetical protein